MKYKMLAGGFLLVIICVLFAYKIKNYEDKVASKDFNAQTENRKPASETEEKESFLDNFRLSKRDNETETYAKKIQKQEDANLVCRSRAAVKSAANSYDDFIWKCNNPPYGVRYTDCSQYNANTMASRVRQIADQRDENEIAFSRKWRVNSINEISCY